VILVGLVAAQVKAVNAMARIRTIKPEFWIDEKIGELSWGARLLFIATWNLADDEGILHWNVAYLRGHVFTYDVHVPIAKIKDLMQELIDKKLIEKYDVGGDAYAFMVHFSNHQVINKPMPSKQPLPTSPNFKARYTNNSSSNTGTFQEHSSGEMERERELELERNKEGTESSFSKSSKELTELFKALILKNNPEAKLPENFSEWQKDFDLMISTDKRIPENIESIIRWCQADSFWRTNILSPDKLRKQYDQLYMKMNAGGKHNEQPTTSRYTKD
jgi:hypothetical protein